MKKLSKFREILLDIILDLAEHGNKWKMLKDRTNYILANTPPNEGKLLKFPKKIKEEKRSA